MAKKLATLIVLLLVAAVGIYAYMQYTPEADTRSVRVDAAAIVDTFEPASDSSLAIGPDNAQFLFEGFAVGKSHEGTFDVWSGEIGLADGNPVSVSLSIDANSVNTGIDGLDKHLRNEDFFTVEEFPTIEFESKSLDTRSGQAIGALTFLGHTETIAFPVTIADGRATADFLVDTAPYGMKYAGVNPEVRIAFDVPLQ